jgi:malate synthase
VGINNLMEDTATAEISRAQLWQWIRHRATLDDTGEAMTPELYREVRSAEMKALVGARGDATRYDDAAALLDELVLGESFAEFLTIRGSSHLDRADVNQDVGE